MSDKFEEFASAEDGAMQWISVKDRMPSNYDEVMIWPRPDFGYESFTGLSTQGRTG